MKLRYLIKKLKERMVGKAGAKFRQDEINRKIKKGLPIRA
jgi:hypothetical protein